MPEEWVEDPVRKKAICGVCGLKMRRPAESLMLVRGPRVIKRVCGELCKIEYERRGVQPG